MSRSRSWRLPAAAAALCLAAFGAAVPPTAAADRGHGGGASTPSTAGTYTNPVSAEFADTFADPSVIRGKDGWWYAVATTDPLREAPEGQEPNPRSVIPMARSANLVDWEYVGDAFTEADVPGSNYPTWADTANGASIWAADLRYVDGEYRLYYVVTETTVTPERFDNAVGVATGPTPTGPWTDSGAPVVGPRRGPGGGADNFLWTFDPNHMRDEATGQQYLMYGSYYGGIWTVPLDETGTRVADGATETQITIDNKYEGAYVVERDGYYYLFVSSANCCNGAATGYSVHVGRSQSITGPYVDRQGVPLLQSRAGGTPVIAPNGNRWIGTGHNAVVTDLAGQDWIVYHALDRDDPYLDGREIGGITERPMLIDRLDWIDGWPTARAGQWASDDEQSAPVASGRRLVTGFDEGAGAGGWRADQGWTVTDGVATSTADGESRITRPGSSRHGVRVEADVRVGAGLTGVMATLRGGSTVRATVDAAGTLTVSLTDRRGMTTSQTDEVGPAAGFDGSDWHSLVLVVSDGVATAELSDARLNDPLAQTTPLDLGRAGRSGTVGLAGAVAVGAGGSVDNLSVAPVAQPVDAVEPEPLGTLDPALSDEFDGALDERWELFRDPQVTVADGDLSWPVQYADIGGSGPSTAALLLQDAPEGDWTVETSVDVSALGVDEVRNFQQGGIVVYVSDDRWVRLSTVAIWNTRQNEFGVELPWPQEADPNATIQGGTIAGPPGERSWLRVQKHTNAEAGELLLSSFTSNDGVTWVRGGTWTMPAGSDPRVGLFSGGATEGTPPAVLTFDYLRWYLP